jgi:hypothetical protein
MNYKFDEVGNKFWYNSKNELHRIDGPAIEWAHGSKEWLINGKYHREDGPAIEHRYGSNQWYINDLLHRLDGPAIEYTDGEKAWYINDEKIDCQNNEEFLRIVKMKELL